MKTIIFYFSGTGNSYYIAKQLSQIIEKTEIANLSTIKTYNLQSYENIGIVYPTYYIHTPALVLQLLEHLKAKKKQNVFTLATYADSLGYALSDLRIILNKNNIEPQEFSLKMPGNYLL